MKLYKNIILITALLFVAAGITQAQGSKANRYRLAQSYEKIGDYENAGRIYEDLYQEVPSNENYFYGLVRAYLARNMYTGLLSIVEKHIKKYESPFYSILYGELLWRTGDNSSANNAWEVALEMAPDNDSVYVALAGTQIKLSLYDKAIRTFETGRNNLGNSRMFADQLSGLYIATGDFDRGCDEIFNLFEMTGDLSLTQGRLSALMTNPEAQEIVRAAIEEKNRTSPKIGYRRISAWFLRTTGDYEAALNVYKEIDDKNNSGGREVLGFANLSRQDGQYDIAIKAFEFILDQGKSNKFLQQAIYGFTRTLELKAEQQDYSNEKYEEIIQRYRQICDEYPNTTTDYDARLRIAEIYLEKLDDNDNALEELEHIITHSRHTRARAKAANKMGEVYILRNELKQAAGKFWEVVRSFQRNNPEAVTHAMYKIAEISYYTGQMDSAEAQFQRLAADPDGEYTNDALEKLGIIKDNSKHPQALIHYAAANLSEKQKEYDDAIEKYLDVAEEAEETPLAELALKHAGTIKFDREDPVGSREIFISLLEKYPKSIYGDYALIYIGNAYLMQAQKEKAMEYFTKLLVDYPRSIYLQEARDKIRKIRTEI